MIYYKFHCQLNIFSVYRCSFCLYMFTLYSLVFCDGQGGTGDKGTKKYTWGIYLGNVRKYTKQLWSPIQGGEHLFPQNRQEWVSDNIGVSWEAVGPSCSRLSVTDGSKSINSATFFFLLSWGRQSHPLFGAIAASQLHPFSSSQHPPVPTVRKPRLLSACMVLSGCCHCITLIYKQMCTFYILLIEIRTREDMLYNETHNKYTFI